jgi:lipooligosaccharide transport system permease protein
MHSTALAATSGARHWRPPSFSTRFYPVWQRNLLVWRKLAVASVLANIADPLLYMLALGYGIGALIGEVGGMSYVAFIGTGMVCQSAMFTASFEGMYSAFSRMHVQRTWDAIINAPVALDDVMLAEWTWCATKALMSTVAILLVLMALGYGRTPFALAILPIGFLIGLVFGAFGLVMNALAPGYDFFTYFFTLVLTPMLLLSGVYFPVEQLPAWLAAAAEILPLKHAIDLARPLMLGRVPDAILLHVAVLAAYAFAAYYVALALTRRRLLK